MRKLLYLTALAFLAIQGVQAQNVIQGTSSMGSGGDFRFGAKAAFMLTDLLGDGIVDNTPLPGFQAGGAMEIPITDEIYFAPEALFSLQGAGGIADNLRLFYLNFPLMGKYHITEEFAVEFGPQLGILLGDNVDDFGLETNALDIGIGAGGGYRLNDNIYFQLRVNTGFIKVLENVKAYNAALQVGAIYYF
ncbi:PorT family protein [Flavobacteriaceae bacterium TP-CH-4]|uniref:PorT family protein n=1 Tax=Pelagihabitans pacificus TaxID=2696054 RepID=A0A967AVR4_9FLAO|nr:porin family protein [Pelagihabitans pacificus]NHF61296.1 PorT family protein [Pelagihabitans pacificus]